MNHRILKKLARSTKWQLLYNRAKDLNSIKLFNNDTDFGKHQIWYMYYLEIYTSLYQDLTMGKAYINKDVIQDDLRTEAYLLYRSEENKKERKEIKNRDKEEKNAGELPRVIFRRRKK